MKKILQIFVLTLCLFCTKTSWGQYINVNGIGHYNNFVLYPHDNTGRINDYRYVDTYWNVGKVKEEKIKNSYYYLSGVLYFVNCDDCIQEIKMNFINVNADLFQSEAPVFHSLNGRYVFMGDFINKFIGNNGAFSFLRLELKIRGITYYDYLEPIYLHNNWEGEHFFYNERVGFRYMWIPIHTPLKTDVNKDNGYNSYLPINEKISIYGRYFNVVNQVDKLREKIYNYQYRFAGETDDDWKDFKGGKMEVIPDYYLSELRAVLQLSATDLFGSEQEAKKHMHKKVQIRVASLKYQGEYLSWSEPTIPLTITPSAPTLTHTSPELVCSYDRGSVEMVLSRNLLPGERLKLSVANANNSGGHTIEGAVDGDITDILLSQSSATPKIRISNLAADTYTISVSGTYTYVDSNGQTQVVPTHSSDAAHTYRVTITPPPALVISQSDVVVESPSCYGGSDGRISLSGVSGGTPPYRYQVVTSGTLPDATAWQVFSQESSFSQGDLKAGNYDIYVTDSKGCYPRHNEKNHFLTAKVLAPQALSMIVTPQQPTDYNSKGSVFLEVSGGTPPYAYSIATSGGTVADSGSLSTAFKDMLATNKLTSGAYVLTLTDAKSCEVQQSFSIKAPLGVVSSSHTDVLCHGANTGTISFEVSGGEPPYFYAFSSNTNDKHLFSGTSVTIEGLMQGTYEIYIFDNAGNQAVARGIPFVLQKKITAPQSPLRFVTQQQMPDSYGGHNGMLEVRVLGGTPDGSGAYAFEWRRGNASGEVLQSGYSRFDGGFLTGLQGLSSGTYHLWVRDANGCVKTEVITLSNPLGILDFSVTDVLCYGRSNGGFSLRADGGKMPYSYRLRKDNDTEGTWVVFTGKELTRNNLAGGDYVLEVRDADGNGALTSSGLDVRRFRVSEPSSALQVSETTNGVSGKGRLDGSLIVEIRGGTPATSGYGVRLENEGGQHVTASHNTFSNGIHRLEFRQLSAGTYRLVITDAHYDRGGAGCSVEKNIRISTPEKLESSIVIEKGISCHHQTKHFTTDNNNNGRTDSSEDGILRAEVRGGTSPYQYVWFRLEGSQRIAVGSDAQLSGLIAGSYVLEVTDKHDNKTSVEITLNEPPLLQWQVGSDSSGCEGSAEGKAWVRVMGGTPPYKYQWSNGAITSELTQLPSGTYTIVVTDANGCQFTDTVVVGTASAIEIIDESLVSPSCVGLSDGRISFTLQGGSGNYSVLWEDGATTLERNGLASGTYSVTITDGTPCGFFKKTFTLIAPEAITLQLPTEITICQGDMREFDISITDIQAQYEWLRDGKLFSNEGKVSITEGGVYIAKVVNAKGCEGTAMMQVYSSNQRLEVNFLVTSYAFYDYAVRLVNVGNRLDTWQWQIPSEAEIISESADHIDVKFPQAGTYTVGLRGTLGDCQKAMHKTLLVEKDTFGEGLEDNKASNIRRFLISPNPNSENFRVLINLHNAEAVRLRTYDMQGRQVLATQERAAAIDFEIPYTHRLAAGQYLVVLEAGREVRVEKMVVK